MADITNEGPTYIMSTPSYLSWKLRAEVWHARARVSGVAFPRNRCLSLTLACSSRSNQYPVLFHFKQRRSARSLVTNGFSFIQFYIFWQ